jgi:hypothetical protein
MQIQENSAAFGFDDFHRSIHLFVTVAGDRPKTSPVRQCVCTRTRTSSPLPISPFTSA